MRSQAWNLALPLAEAGIEEAILLLNYTNALPCCGWQIQGTNYTKTRFFGDDFFTVNVSRSGPPVIVSEGFVAAPLTESNFISRAIHVQTTNHVKFPFSFVARDTIDLNGNDLLIDSFHSGEAQGSTDGQYDPRKRKDMGDVQSVAGIDDAVNSGNAEIYGHVRTGPGGTTSMGASGAIGDLAWHASGNSGSKPGWVSDDMEYFFLDIHVPTGGLIPVGGSVEDPNGDESDSDSGKGRKSTTEGTSYPKYDTTYQYVLPSGVWEVSVLDGPVYVSGDAKLVVTSMIDLTASGDAIVIAEDASLELYMLGAHAKFSGSGVVNDYGKAENFKYFGLPNNTDLQVHGNIDFKGAIYAPDAELFMGGDDASINFVGAAVVYRMIMNGDISAHYDEALGGGAGKTIEIISWREM